MESGDVFRGRSFVTGVPRLVTVVAVDDCELRVLRKSEVDALVHGFLRDPRPSDALPAPSSETR